MSLGLYPAVGLRDARHKRDEIKAGLYAGEDPAARKREKSREDADTFRKLAESWAAEHLPHLDPAHASRQRRRLELHVLPTLGDRRIDEIGTPEVLELVRKIAGTGHTEMARRISGIIGQIFRFGIATGQAVTDPTAALRGALPPRTTRHMAAPTEPGKVGEILRMLEACNTPVVGTAARLMPYVFVRPTELRHMRWEDLDLEAGEWRFTTSKTRTDHLVPLSRQARSMIERLRPLTGDLPGGWVFPGQRTTTRPISNMAINAMYRRIGIDTKNELTGHGWRAVARTLLHERLGYPPEVIEHQLAHKVPDTLGRAYNRTRFIEQRREMMQRWADYLDGLREGRNEAGGGEMPKPQRLIDPTDVMG